jgi:hypothetical protein
MAKRNKPLDGSERIQLVVCLAQTKDCISLCTHREPHIPVWNCTLPYGHAGDGAACGPAAEVKGQGRLFNEP